MGFTESGHDYLNTSTAAEERAECQTQTCHALTHLQCEMIGAEDLPEAVTDYIAKQFPTNQRENVLIEATRLQTLNPAVFSVPANILPMILDAALGDFEISAKRKTLKTEHEIGKELDTTIDVLSDEVQLEEIARTDPSLKDLSGHALIDALYRLGFVRERPELQNRLKMIGEKLDAVSSVAANPAEAQALQTIIGQSILYFGADNPAEIFTDVLARTDSDPNLSEATKSKVHELFNIPTVKTAADIQMVLNQGDGIGEDGERMPFTKDNKARVFENTYVYETPTGERRFQVNLSGGRNINIAFDGETKAQTLADLVYTTQIIFEMEKMSLAEPIFKRGWNITHGGNIDLHFNDIITAKRIGTMFLGGLAGYDARLLSDSNQDQIAHNFQAFPRKGDAAYGNNNADKAMEEYQDLTIINDDGTINWTRFEKAGLYLQDVTARGGQPNFDDLKTYLTGNKKNSA